MSFLVARARGETDTLQSLIGHVFLRALLVCESVSKQVSVRQGKKKQTQSSEYKIAMSLLAARVREVIMRVKEAIQRVLTSACLLVTVDLTTCRDVSVCEGGSHSCG